MKLTVMLAALAVTGCASYDSRLDVIGKRPNPPFAVSDEQVAALQAEIARLRAGSEPLRMELAAEPDRLKRIALYRNLRRNGDRIRPLEGSLAQAGRPTRITVAP